MTVLIDGDPVDANGWLIVHEDELVGALRTSAVDLIHDAGLVSHLSHYRGSAPDPDVPDEGRIRLFIGDDDTVRTARWG